jgi:hypothetical protein
MTKKTVMALVIAGTITYKSFSQETKKDTIQKRNEIALDIETPLFYAIGGNSFDYGTNNFAIMSKHYMHKSGIRLGITGTIGDSYSNYNGDWNHTVFPSSTTITTNSTVSYLIPEWAINNMIGLSGGYEYLMGRKKLKHFIGLDANASILSVTGTTFREIDSTNYYPYGYGYGYGVSIGSKKSSLAKFGLFPFYGIKYPISNHFSLSMQVGLQYYWISGLVKYMADDNNIYTQSVHQSGLHADSFISDISLIYRF